MQIKRSIAAMAAGLVLAGTVQAAPVTGQGTWGATLQARDLDGNGSVDAYWDQVLDITWLREAGESRTWADANTWVDNLMIGSYGGWRLPNIVDGVGDGPANCTMSGGVCDYNVDTSSSEMAHLYHLTLGNKAIYDTAGNFLQPGWGLTNTGPFTGLEALYYWSGTTDASDAGYAWYFDMDWGKQDTDDKTAQNRTLAVHDGDIGRAVPEPGALALVLIALAAARWSGCRRLRR